MMSCANNLNLRQILLPLLLSFCLLQIVQIVGGVQKAQKFDFDQLKWECREDGNNVELCREWKLRFDAVKTYREYKRNIAYSSDDILMFVAVAPDFIFGYNFLLMEEEFAEAYTAIQAGSLPAREPPPFGNAEKVQIVEELRRAYRSGKAGAEGPSGGGGRKHYERAGVQEQLQHELLALRAYLPQEPFCRECYPASYMGLTVLDWPKIRRVQVLAEQKSSEGSSGKSNRSSKNRKMSKAEKSESSADSETAKKSKRKQLSEAMGRMAKMEMIRARTRKVKDDIKEFWHNRKEKRREKSLQ